MYGLGTTTSFLLIVGETSINYSPSFDSNIGLIELNLDEDFEIKLPLCRDPEKQDISYEIGGLNDWIVYGGNTLTGTAKEVGVFNLSYSCSDGVNVIQ